MPPVRTRCTWTGYVHLASVSSRRRNEHASGVLEPARAFQWVYGGDQKDLVYDFTPNRSRAGPLAFLEGYEGHLQVDAYSGFDAVFAVGRVIEVGCWAHARRYVYEAVKTALATAPDVLGLIRGLYRVEREASEGGLIGEARRQLRQERSRPILDRVDERLRVEVQRHLPKSPMGEAIVYLRRQWKALVRYIHWDGAPQGALCGGLLGERRRCEAAPPWRLRKRHAMRRGPERHMARRSRTADLSSGHARAAPPGELASPQASRGPGGAGVRDQADEVLAPALTSGAARPRAAHRRSRPPVAPRRGAAAGRARSSAGGRRRRATGRAGAWRRRAGRPRAAASAG